MRRILAALAMAILVLGGGTAAAQGTWVRVVGPGAATAAGFGDTDNTMAMSSAVLDGQLYVGTFNYMYGSEVWRTANGNTWEQVNTDGFGGTVPANNVGAYSMEVFNGKVYAGTWASGYPSSAGAPSMVWRYDDVPAWFAANTSTGFAGTSNAEPWAMEVFPGDTPFLYVGVANYPNGARIWRAHNGLSWLRSNADGFGNVNNKEISSLAYFNGYMYAATLNEALADNGLELWRTDVAASIDSDWAEVNGTAGFGGPNHTAAYSMEVFAGYLYLSTFNYSSGGQVYRSSNGTTWDVIPQSADGFGDANNWGAMDMVAHDGALYLGTFNPITGTEVWRTTNGTTWTQVNSNGFGTQRNFAVFTFAELDGVLYAGLRNDDGCQVWKLALFADGFESGNTSAWSTAIP